jgi:hypothetical protein
MNQNSNESFTAHDPAFFADSCKNLIKEKAKINRLSSKYCSTKSATTPNREEINKERNCYVMTEKKINIDNEQPSWCSRVPSDQLAQIQTDAMQEILTAPELEGPGYMDSQYTLNNIQPNELSIHNLSYFDSTLPLQSYENEYNYSQYFNMNSLPSPAPGYTPSSVPAPSIDLMYAPAPSIDLMYAPAPSVDSMSTSVPITNSIYTPAPNGDFIQDSDVEPDYVPEAFSNRYRRF